MRVIIAVVCVLISFVQGCYDIDLKYKLPSCISENDAGNPDGGQ